MFYKCLNFSVSQTELPLKSALLPIFIPCNDISSLKTSHFYHPLQKYPNPTNRHPHPSSQPLEVINLLSVSLVFPILDTADK